MFYQKELEDIEKTMSLGKNAIKVLEERRQSLNEQISQKEYELMEILITGKNVTDEEMEKRENEYFRLICRLASVEFILDMAKDLQNDLKKRRHFIRMVSQN